MLMILMLIRINQDLIFIQQTMNLLKKEALKMSFMMKIFLMWIKLSLLLEFNLQKVNYLELHSQKNGH